MLEVLWHWTLGVLWPTPWVLADLSEMCSKELFPRKCRKTENLKKIVLANIPQIKNSKSTGKFNGKVQ